ncbi:MAG: hypothetical protein LBS16_00970, partial [Prevotellaceae bacterium]|nr:hypothetical protein [Prevotellaceae bacterium]
NQSLNIRSVPVIETGGKGTSFFVLKKIASEFSKKCFQLLMLSLNFPLLKSGCKGKHYISACKTFFKLFPIMLNYFLLPL